MGPLKLKMLFRTTCQSLGLTQGPREAGEAGGQAGEIDGRGGELSPGLEEDCWALGPKKIVCPLGAVSRPPPSLRLDFHLPTDGSHGLPGCPKGPPPTSWDLDGTLPPWGHRFIVKQQCL